MHLRTLSVFTLVALAMYQAPALAQTNCSILLNYTVLEDVDKKTADDAQTKLVAQGATATTNCDDDECSVVLPITLKSTLPQTVAASIRQDLEQLGIKAEVTCGGTPATAGAACTITPQQQSKFNTPLAQLDLSVRAYNSLKAGNFKTLGEVVSKTPADFLQIRNFGKKTLTELEALVADQGLRFGMKTSCP